MPRRIGTVLTATIAALMLGACSQSPAPRPQASTSPAPLSALFMQGRADVVAGLLAVQLSNAGDEPVEVGDVSVSGPSITRATGRTGRTSRIAGGVTVAIRMPAPRLDCGASPAPATVTVQWRQADGPWQVVDMPAGDPQGYLARIRDRQCLAEQVAAIATLAIADEVSITRIGGVDVARLTLLVDRTEPGLQVLAVRATTLFSHVDPRDGRVTGDMILQDPTAERIVLTLVPGRCDLHAIAEDKRGTVFPVEVRLPSGRGGIVDVASSPEVRKRLQDFVVRECADQASASS